MLQLVYASSAVRPAAPEALETLLEKARAKNDRLGVTGMLLYREERFLQVLEGQEHTVRRLYDTIRRDERHTAVITLRECLIDERAFSGWMMGFMDLDRADPGDLPDGCEPFMNGEFTLARFRKDPGLALRALLQFRDPVAR